MLVINDPALPQNHPQRAKIIAGFSGIGKTYFVKYCLPTQGPLAAYKFIDLDAATYQKTGEEYPENYIAAIRRQAQAANTVVLIGTDPAVRQTLIEKGYSITLVYPQVAHKNFYLKRYRDMKRDAKWVSDMDAVWESYMSNLMDQEGCRHVVLRNAQNFQGIAEEVIVNEPDNRETSKADGFLPNGGHVVHGGGANGAGVKIYITDTTQTITIPGQAPIIVSRIRDPLSRIAMALFAILLLAMVSCIVCLESERRVYVAANDLTRVRILDALEFWLQTEKKDLVLRTPGS